MCVCVRTRVHVREGEVVGGEREEMEMDTLPSKDIHLKENSMCKALVLVLRLSYSLATLSSTENNKMTHISAP